MLLEAPRQDEKNAGGNVTYLKLYLMSINVIKSVMLLVAVLGPQRISTAIISSIVASFLLGTLTYTWFQAQDLVSLHYSADLQPCNIAFINYWKAASYTAAVASAVMLVIAHALQESRFSAQTLTETLIATWVVIVLLFAFLYYRYNKRLTSRRALVAALMSYPFDVRKKKEAVGLCDEKPPPACVVFDPLTSGLINDRKTEKIPGSNVSPWSDQRYLLDVPNKTYVYAPLYRAVTGLHSFSSMSQVLLRRQAAISKIKEN